MAERILNGQTGVWVLITTGNKEADAKAEETLKKSLKKAEKTLKLPKIDEEDITGDPEEFKKKLRIEFSYIKISAKTTEDHGTQRLD